MTEMSPVGSFCGLKPEVAGLTGEALYDQKKQQGFAPFGVQFRLTDDDNRDLPWDGETFGRLKVSGFAVAKSYFRSDEPILDEHGFFDTGDVATIDPHGYMAITDRSKDVIKSGGEWISSIDLENLAVGHPDVAEAAVIGVAHPKWDERPLLIVVPKEGRTPDKADILAFMRRASPSGGCPTTWCWCPRSRTPPPKDPEDRPARPVSATTPCRGRRSRAPQPRHSPVDRGCRFDAPALAIAAAGGAHRLRRRPTRTAVASSKCPRKRVLERFGFSSVSGRRGLSRAASSSTYQR